MEEKNKKEKVNKKPSLWGLAAYAAIILVFGLAALFAGRIARGIDGPILCIYVAVLPKYILGLAFIFAGIDGVLYGIRFFRDEPVIRVAAGGIQTAALVIFLFFIFPVALKEGVPPGNTYNLMRLLIFFMLLVTAWDFIKETIDFRKSKKEPGKEA
ncbi:MAG: hypothetical protein JXB33_10415 [Clostridia bacterium]|nr:hypothetical protein [Clostridia bacterium]